MCIGIHWTNNAQFFLSILIGTLPVAVDLRLDTFEKGKVKLIFFLQISVLWPIAAMCMLDGSYSQTAFKFELIFVSILQFLIQYKEIIL